MDIGQARSRSRPVLVTVHGTGAGQDEDSGARWWQKTSPFQIELSKRLRLSPDDVEIVPHQWDHGPNSEAARREAASALLERLKAYEADKRAYYLIGHSHGGSVIYNMLLQSVDQKIVLNQLRVWCTVATPFLDYHKNKYLWQRLKTFGLNMLASCIVSIVLALAIIISISIWDYEKSTDDAVFTEGVFMAHWASVLFVCGAIGLFAIIRAEKRKNPWFSLEQKREVEERYGPRWLGLWHRKDEAISALANVKRVNAPIIPREFVGPAVPFLQMVVVFALGIFLVYDSMLGGFWLNDLDIWIENAFLAAVSWLFWHDAFEDAFGYMFYTIFEPHNFSSDASDEFTYFTARQIVLGFIKIVVLFSLTMLSAFLIWSLKFFIAKAGVPLSNMLNRIIWTSIRNRAWGDDLPQEDVVSVASHPPMFGVDCKPLPEEVAAPLREYSDLNAISTLNKVRRILGMASDAPTDAPGLRTELAEALQWQELIHTAYFEVPEFIDLIALGLAQAGLERRQSGFAQNGEVLEDLEEWLLGIGEGGTTDQAPARAMLPKPKPNAALVQA